MIEYKDSKWAKYIISSQYDEGNWGYFHSLSNPTKANNITTEQALRRLEVLGYTKEDVVIKKALEYMIRCLKKEIEIPDRKEKCHNWNAFTELMLSTWIRRFTKENEFANSVSAQWCNIISGSLNNCIFDKEAYKNLFIKILKAPPKGGVFINPITFYTISLLSDKFDESIENNFFEYILNYKKGIYYRYEKELNIFPVEFASKQASLYLSAFELLADYKNQRRNGKISFILPWLLKNKNENGLWDMGQTAKDGVHFPLSDSWREKRLREKDCSYRINKLIESISVIA